MYIVPPTASAMGVLICQVRAISPNSFLKLPFSCIFTDSSCILLPLPFLFPAANANDSDDGWHFVVDKFDAAQSGFVPKDYLSSWAQYSLLAKSKFERNEVMSILSNASIPSMIYYKLPLHLQTVFKKLGYEKGDFPISEKTSRQIFSIPMHPYLDNEKQNRIIEVLNKY